MQTLIFFFFITLDKLVSVLIHNNAVSRPLIKLTDGTFVDLEMENRDKLYIEQLL